jgi:hypothetical protein
MVGDGVRETVAVQPAAEGASSVGGIRRLGEGERRWGQLLAKGARGAGGSRQTCVQQR